jgi:molecular chaperone DnaK (HSP70)
MSVIAIDFGTTNTTVSEWVPSTNDTKSLIFSGISKILSDSSPVIPSLLYVENLKTKSFLIGNAVRTSALDISSQANDRLFREMKRVVLNGNKNAHIFEEGNLSLSHNLAAEYFLNHICQLITDKGISVEELVLTAPVNSFEKYLKWLGQAISKINLPPESLPRIIDEPTAAAFGYGLNNPGDVVLVVDFGGGTLDLSIVRLPLENEKSGKGIVIKSGLSPEVEIARGLNRISARVIAKTHREVGGADIDKIFLEYILEECEISVEDILDDLPLVKREIEDAKIALSQDHETEINIILYQTLKIPLYKKITRQEFEEKVLREQRLDVLGTMRSAISEILATAESNKNIGDNDINHVLLVGGSSMIPSIKDLVIDRFGKERIIQKNPFEAISKGALILATSHPLLDILQHSYALEVKRQLNGPNGPWEIDYLKLILAGTEFPTPWIPIIDTITGNEVYLQPTSDNVNSIEFLIAEIEENSKPGERIVFDSSGERVSEKCKDYSPNAQTIRLLHEKQSISLNPPGMMDQKNRLKLDYKINENRSLMLSVKDTKNISKGNLFDEQSFTKLD